jgi:SAM-dependent methyltransferase
MSDRFVEIYQTGEWGSASRSGPGSTLERNQEYLRILSDTLGRTGASSVVDLGCGDWSFSRVVDWAGVDYTGIDVVPKLVAELNSSFATDTIRFIVGDSRVSNLPNADLLIAKDVLQHWSNEAVLDFLPHLNRFKYAILTNDLKILRKGFRSFWRYRSVCPANSETSMGGYRPLELAAAPFGLNVEHLAFIEMKDGPHLFVKEVVLWKNPEAA